MLTSFEKAALRSHHGLLTGTHQWSVSAVRRNHHARIRAHRRKAAVKSWAQKIANGAMVAGLGALAVYLMTLT